MYFWSYLLACISGFMLAAGFPNAYGNNFGLSAIAMFGFVPLFIAIKSLKKGVEVPPGLRSRPRAISPFRRGWRAFLCCWIAGSAMVAVAFLWIIQPAVLFGGLPRWLAYLGYGLYSVAAGVFLPAILLPFIWNASRVARKGCRPFPIFPLAVLAGCLECILPCFFNWTFGSLLHSFSEINQWSAIFGFNAMSVAMIATGAWMGRILTSRPFSVVRIGWEMVGVVGCWLGIFMLGSVQLHRMDRELQQVPKSRIGYVQPNFTFDELSSNPDREPEGQQHSLSTMINMSQELVDKSVPQKLDLIVWPESTTPHHFVRSPVMVDMVKNFAAKNGVPILVQATEFSDGASEDSDLIYSSSFVIKPDGSRTPSYQKWVPIPFGESVPFEEYFPQFAAFLRRYIRNLSHVGIGKSYQALPYAQDLNVAPLICFDSIEPRLARLQAGQGNASVFVNQANFVWMGHSAAGAQFREIDRFRAIENGRSLVLVGNTGPTLAFDPLGRLLPGEVKMFTRSTGYFELPIYSPLTFYTQYGNVPLFSAGVVSVLILLVRARRRLV